MTYFEFPETSDPAIALIYQIIRENGYIAIRDKDAVRTFVEEAVENPANAKLIVAYNKTKQKKVLGKLYAEVMKRTNNGVEPASMIDELLVETIK